MADTMTRPGDTRLPWRTGGALVSGSVLQPLNSSMIALAIVSLTADFGASDLMPWVIAAMYIATAVAAPVSGRLGALLGPRRVYLAGLGLILAGSALGLLAPSLAWVVVSRVIVGLGTATQYPNAVALVRRYARRRHVRTGGILGLLAIGAQVTVAFGPTLGGLLVGLLGWQAVMWINVPVVVASALLVGVFVDRDDPVTVTRRELPPAFDLPGIGLFLGWVVSLMMFLLSAVDEPQWWLLGVFVVCAVLFVQRERHTASPFLDVSALVRNRALFATLIRTLLTYVAFYAVYFGFPQWMQAARGLSPAQAGLMMFPLAAIGVVCSLVATRTCRIAGPRRVLVGGTAAMIAGGVIIAFAAGSRVPALLVLVAVVAGIPSGFNNIGNQTVVDRATPDGDVGTAMGLYRTTQFIGANFAAVALDVLVGPDATDAGFERLGWFTAALGVLLLAVTVAARSLRPEHPI
ncbi:MFS transporter [Cryptosporangium aurantiacum]|uniref:Predicted arabinose efflux permease, MFS family n=1 Tax=Cryptosporangium aurantiacum TaxID=134849 RepID=A0A1M7R3R0_9ACTN|nr:MFS transporter [Cryptosporangium aurantiacum]SHN39546.1 Predicted arabinose efflux permease, MFS family [Cryptosporangium aurantiacum]